MPLFSREQKEKRDDRSAQAVSLLSEKGNQMSNDFFKDTEPPALTARQLDNCRVLPNRLDILKHIPKGGVCAELGTQTGYYAKHMWETLEPGELHIYDLDFSPFDSAWFEAPIATGAVSLHEGDSSTLLSLMPDEYFDFIYIDGDHGYRGVKKDLLQAVKKIKKNGIVACNDYTMFNPFGNHKYGICKAVHEICLEFDFELLFLALHCWGFHDVVLRRRGES